MTTTTRIRMARKPTQALVRDDFIVENIEVAAPGSDEVLTQIHYLSLDPYLISMMRSWEGPEVADWSQGIIVGRMVGQVIESNAEGFAPGDWIGGAARWQELDVQPAKVLYKIQSDPDVPLSAHLGLFGSSGLTAWLGIHRVLQLKAGETLAISSAAGNVGAIAGQIAKSLGASVVGIAGGPEKCAEVIALGFDGCVDHRSETLAADLGNAAPSGIDAHFENVGAKMLDSVLVNMNEEGRIALCGLIAHYQDNNPITLDNFRDLLYRGLTIKGFRLFDYSEDYGVATQELMSLFKAGDIALRETITEGVENAPDAFISMIAGGGVGKHLIRLKS